MRPSKLKIVGKDYSVYDPVRLQLGLRLWTEALLRALPQHAPLMPGLPLQGKEKARANVPGSSDS